MSGHLVTTHGPDNCPATCCRMTGNLATPYQTLYEREQRVSADLCSKLDELWDRFNAAGDLLTNAGIKHELEGHVSSLAEIRADQAQSIEGLETFRRDMLAYVFAVEDGKLTPAELPTLIYRANKRAKNA